MDQAISSLFPTHQIGNDGFNWWIGQVEDVNDVKKSGRIKVKIVGIHDRKTPRDQLPWSQVIMPPNVPYTDGGTTGASINFEVGSWVVGFYLDNERQRPIVMGSIARTKSATFKELADFDPSLDTFGFNPTRSKALNPSKHRSFNEQEGKDATGAQTDQGVTATADAANPPPVIGALKLPHSKNNPTGGKVCVEVADPKCDSKDIGTSMKKIIGEILKNTQQSGGALGSYYVGVANGELYSAIDIPKKYIGKITRLMSSFAKRLKAEIVFGIKEGIDNLVRLIMGVQTAKQIAEQAGDKPKNPKESFVPNTERGNFLKQVIDTFNKILNELGCSFTKTIDDLIGFITDLILEYLQDAFNAAFCLIDSLVTNVTKFLESGFQAIVDQVLGPLQDLLGTFGSFLDIVGGVINKVLNFLGISCTGVDDKCAKKKTKCSDGTDKDKKGSDEDFLDRLLKEIEEGSLTGKKLGDVSRSVCSEAKTNGGRDATSAIVSGGTLNTKAENDYTATTTTIPDVPLSLPTFPGDDELPGAVNDPYSAVDTNPDTSPYIDYTVKAQRDKIESGETATFIITGPKRNGVVEILVDDFSVIPSESNVAYEECILETDDGIGIGFAVVVQRDADGVPTVNITNPGTGYLPGTQFVLNGSKIGGEDITDDIGLTITVVGERLQYQIFGDVYAKNLVDDEEYPEFGEFLYTQITSVSIPTIARTNVGNPSYIGLELVQKRAADSIVIWSEDPEEKFRQDIDGIKNVNVTTEKDDYFEGEVITFNIETENYPDGTIFTYELFGTLTADKDYEIYNPDASIVIENNKAELVVITNLDPEPNGIRSLTLLVRSTDELDRGVGSKQVFVLDRDFIRNAELDTFAISSDTTQQQLEDYLNEVGTTTTTNFGDFSIPLPPELQFINTGQQLPDDEPNIIQLPILGSPVVDADGSIISIPVDYKGNRTYQIPPKVIIDGNGYGAAAIALLDNQGFLSEIRVTRIGVGYVPNLPEDNGLNCVIDSFTIIRPGFGYTSPPKIYIDGDPDIVEATIDEFGQINGTKVLNRSKAFSTIPEIVVVGGGGAGGFVLPSLVCLPPKQLQERGYVKIGTGSYIDCP